MTNQETVSPLFPLTVNVLPGALLPLQIFEPRYIDMVKRSLSKSEGFCIALTMQENPPGESQSCLFRNIATYVEIIDFNQLDNGLLGITVQGKQKVIIEDTWEQDDQLLIGKIKKIKERDDDFSSDPKYFDLWDMVKDITNHPEIKKLNLELDLESSISVSYILASVLPLRSEEKQTILEFEDPRDKLDYMKEIIKKLGG